MNKSKTIFDLLQKVEKFGRDFGALDFLLNHHSETNFLQRSEDTLRGFDPISPKYINIRSVASKLCLAPLSQEKSNLLTYMDSLRAVHMSQTYIDQVKSFSLNFFELTKDEENRFAKHARNAFILSQDEEILELAKERFTGILKKISLPLKISSGLKKFDSSDFSPKEHENNLVFDNFDNENFLQKINPAELSHIQRQHGVSINKSRMKGDDEYRKCLNRLLESYGLSQISKLRLDENVLDTITFEKPIKKRGPLVSIIMSCFNSQETVGYALKSLTAQSYEDIEILVCDDNSKDKSLEVMKEFARIDSRIRVFSSRGNQGTYNIRNSLIPHCKGKYVTFQDSDDVAVPERIELQVEHLVKTGALVTSCRWIRLSPHGEVIFFPDGLINRFCVVSTMVAKDVFGIIPRFRKSLVAADTEFHELCIYMLGPERVITMDLPLLLGLWGDGSLTKMPGLQAENNGCVAERRRVYSDIASRQRVLGPDIVSDNDIDDVLKDLGIYREYNGVREEVVG